MAVLVEGADVADREGARWLFRAIDQQWTALAKVWADQAYNGDLAAWLRGVYGIDLEVVERAPEQHGFTVLPRRWVVERTEPHCPARPRFDRRPAACDHRAQRAAAPKLKPR